MSVLVIIHLKVILIKTIQTTLSLFNQFCFIVSKHKSILSKSILSESILSESILSKVKLNGFSWDSKSRHGIPKLIGERWRKEITSLKP